MTWHGMCGAREKLCVVSSLRVAGCYSALWGLMHCSHWHVWLCPFCRLTLTVVDCCHRSSHRRHLPRCFQLLLMIFFSFLRHIFIHTHTAILPTIEIGVLNVWCAGGGRNNGGHNLTGRNGRSARVKAWSAKQHLFDSNSTTRKKRCRSVCSTLLSVIAFPQLWNLARIRHRNHPSDALRQNFHYFFSTY